MTYSEVLEKVLTTAVAEAKKAGAFVRYGEKIGSGNNPIPPWCDISVKLSESSVRDIANGPSPRRHGVLFISVYDEKGRGERKILSIIDHLVNSLEFSTAGVIEFENSTVTELNYIEQSFNKHVLEIPFHTA